MVKLTEIISSVVHVQRGNISKNETIYNLREIYVNPQHVVLLREEENLNMRHERSSLLEGLDEFVRFTKVNLNAGTNSSLLISVVGDLQHVAEKVGASK